MIYLVITQDNQFCKIGYAANAIKRLSELQTGFPYTLRLLATFPGARDDEADWHRDYASQRTRGEWFRVTPQLLREFIWVASNEVYDLDPAPYARLDHKILPLGPSFWQIARTAGGLWDMAVDVAAVVDDGTEGVFCANTVWYRSFKPRFQHLVGFGAKGAAAEVRTPTAYRVAYQAIYHCLPHCRNCWCA